MYPVFLMKNKNHENVDKDDLKRLEEFIVTEIMDWKATQKSSSAS